MEKMKDHFNPTRFKMIVKASSVVYFNSFTGDEIHI